MGDSSFRESRCNLRGRCCPDHYLHYHYHHHTQPETWELVFGEEEAIFDKTLKASSPTTRDKRSKGNNDQDDDGEEDPWLKKKKRQQVYLEGYVKRSSGQEEADDLGRTKSLTDEDLEELKGCLDLGFGGFSYEEIPELCNTLPALELCYSMSQNFLDEQLHNHKPPPPPTPIPPPESCASTPNIANWKISSPGDHPEDVKARLKFWAQAVACTVRLCS